MGAGALVLGGGASGGALPFLYSPQGLAAALTLGVSYGGTRLVMERTGAQQWVDNFLWENVTSRLPGVQTEIPENLNGVPIPRRTAPAATNSGATNQPAPVTTAPTMVLPAPTVSNNSEAQRRAAEAQRNYEQAQRNYQQAQIAAQRAQAQSQAEIARIQQRQADNDRLMSELQLAQGAIRDLMMARTMGQISDAEYEQRLPGLMATVDRAEAAFNQAMRPATQSASGATEADSPAQPMQMRNGVLPPRQTELESTGPGRGAELFPDVRPNVSNTTATPREANDPVVGNPNGARNLPQATPNVTNHTGHAQPVDPSLSPQVMTSSSDQSQQMEDFISNVDREIGGPFLAPGTGTGACMIASNKLVRQLQAQGINAEAINVPERSHMFVVARLNNGRTYVIDRTIGQFIRPDGNVAGSRTQQSVSDNPVMSQLSQDGVAEVSSQREINDYVQFLRGR